MFGSLGVRAAKVVEKAVRQEQDFATTHRHHLGEPTAAEQKLRCKSAMRETVQVRQVEFTHSPASTCHSPNNVTTLTWPQFDLVMFFFNFFLFMFVCMCVYTTCVCTCKSQKKGTNMMQLQAVVS